MVCRNCTKEFDTKLNNCPHCGSRKKKFRFKDFLRHYMRFAKGYQEPLSCKLFAIATNNSHLKVILWRYFGFPPRDKDITNLCVSLDIPRSYIEGTEAFDTQSIMYSPGSVIHAAAIRNIEIKEGRCIDEMY